MVSNINETDTSSNYKNNENKNTLQNNDPTKVVSVRKEWQGEVIKDWSNNSSYFIHFISAKGSGEGIEKVKKVVSSSLALGCEGRVHISASYSSHIFWLKMGFIPYDDGVKYNYYKAKHINILRDLRVVEKHADADEGLLDDLQDVLFNEQLRTLDHITKRQNITRQEVLDHREMLEELAAEEGVRPRFIFIPKLLSILRSAIRNNIGRPDTRELYGVKMILSDEGRARWRAAIQENKSFVLFRQYELLRPMMNARQTQELDLILEEQAKNVSSKKV